MKRIFIIFALMAVARASECTDANARLNKILDGIHPEPIGWHWMVVCSDKGFERTKQLYDVQHTGRAFTVTQYHMTFFNVNVFSTVDAEYVVRHEIGHIRCKCADESKATSLGSKEHDSGS